MSAWWLLGGLVGAVVGILLFQCWQIRRRPRSVIHSVMTKTMDGEPLQFLVRPTRKG